MLITIKWAGAFLIYQSFIDRADRPTYHSVDRHRHSHRHLSTVNGEGDGLSGLVLDVCVGHAMQVVVVMSSASCCEVHKELIEQEVTKALE
jgi:hypothetical protein